MKILIVRNFPSYMAIKNNTYNIQEVGLARALVRKGHVCDIVFWTDNKSEIVTLPVDTMGEIHIFYRRGITKLKNTIFTECRDLFEKYDILQPCEYNQMQSLLLAKSQPQKTVIYHGPYYSPFNKRYNLMCIVFDFLFLRQYIKLGTHFLLKSEMAEKFLIDKGIKVENMNVVGVGIDAEMLSSTMEECTEPLYHAMKANNDDLKLLYIGRFEERRNIQFIVDVFKKILEKKPRAHLYMIGTGDSEYLKMSYAYMEKVGVRDKIVWQESIEQKYLSNIYEMADFFLLPTEYEIFGMVLLESMFYGMVVLTTLNGGSSTLIQNGENGFILNDLNTELWANCILDVNHDLKRQKMIGMKAKETISKKYTWDALVDGFVNQYEYRLKS